jgi:hypothetical protein
LPTGIQQPNAPRKRDLLGTVLLSVPSGHYRYAHLTTLRCDAVNPRLLGMTKVVSEDAVRFPSRQTFALGRSMRRRGMP